MRTQPGIGERKPYTTPTLRRLERTRVTAMFEADRIARSIETVAAFCASDHFDVEGQVLDDVLGISGRLLAEWAQRRTDDEGASSLAGEAALIAVDISIGVSVERTANRARDWANAVRGWASMMGAER